MIAGQLNIPERTFDIFSMAETQAHITITPCLVTLSYLDTNGKVIQLKKTLDKNPLAVHVGSNLIASGIKDSLGGGYVEPTTAEGMNIVGKSIAHADFGISSTLEPFQQKSFVDQHGITRAAILLPVQLM